MFAWLKFTMFQQERRGSMNTRVYAVSFYHAETPKASVKQLGKPPLPIILFDTVAYASMLLYHNLSQNSCRRKEGSSRATRFLFIRVILYQHRNKVTWTSLKILANVLIYWSKHSARGRKWFKRLHRKQKSCSAALYCDSYSILLYPSSWFAQYN